MPQGCFWLDSIYKQCTQGDTCPHDKDVRMNLCMSRPEQRWMNTCRNYDSNSIRFKFVRKALCVSLFDILKATHVYVYIIPSY